jgi:hypothetical protein
MEVAIGQQAGREGKSYRQNGSNPGQVGAHKGIGTLVSVSTSNMNYRG